MLRAIIIDDEDAGIQTLRLLTERYSNGIKIIGSSTDPYEGIQMVDDFRPDILFLDISMPLMNGFELLDRLSFKDFRLVFTTAHEEFAIKAIKLKAFDYLLKPIDVDDFKNCMTLLKEPQKPTMNATVEVQQTILELPVRDGIIFLKQKEIIRLEASGSYTQFFTEDGEKYVVSKSLKEYEQHLDAHLFYRCHHSHIINLGKVFRFINHEGLFVRMCDGSQVEIARKNKDIFLERLKSFT